MKITGVETFVLSNRCLLVKISSSTSAVGWGEATLENWVLPVATTVQQMANYLHGQDPRRITHHWQVLARGGFYRGGPVFGSAIAGIDQALWDLSGQALGAPIHDLLGGATRDRVRIYPHANGLPDRTGHPERAKALIAAGYTLVKVAPDRRTKALETAQYVDQFVRDLTILREAIGDEADFAVDLHGRFSVPLSRAVLPQIEHLKPLFIEEPLRPEHSSRIAEIARTTSIPLATGERLYDRYEFRPVLEAGIAIAQPDLAHAGGITEVVKIAAQAEVYDALLAPHCPLGPVALAACLQIDLAIPNFLAQESVVEVHDPKARLGQQFLTNPEVLYPVDGHIPRLTGAGLGITINEEAVRDAVVSGPLAAGSPTWNHHDGSFAEW